LKIIDNNSKPRKGEYVGIGNIDVKTKVKK